MIDVLIKGIGSLMSYADTVMNGKTDNDNYHKMITTHIKLFKSIESQVRDEFRTTLYEYDRAKQILYSMSKNGVKFKLDYIDEVALENVPRTKYKYLPDTDKNSKQFKKNYAALLVTYNRDLNRFENIKKMASKSKEFKDIYRGFLITKKTPVPLTRSLFKQSLDNALGNSVSPYLIHKDIGDVKELNKILNVNYLYNDLTNVLHVINQGITLLETLDTRAVNITASDVKEYAKGNPGQYRAEYVNCVVNIFIDMIVSARYALYKKNQYRVKHLNDTIEKIRNK